MAVFRYTAMRNSFPDMKKYTQPTFDHRAIHATASRCFDWSARSAQKVLPFELIHNFFYLFILNPSYGSVFPLPRSESRPARRFRPPGNYSDNVIMHAFEMGLIRLTEFLIFSPKKINIHVLNSQPTNIVLGISLATIQ